MAFTKMKLTNYVQKVNPGKNCEVIFVGEGYPKSKRIQLMKVNI